MRFEVFVPALPQQVLSSNAGKNSRKDPHSRGDAVKALKLDAIEAVVGHRVPAWIIEARMRLKDDVVQAIIGQPDLPRFETCVITVTLRRANRRPLAELCPRCTLLVQGGEYPAWGVPKREPGKPDKPLKCVCYRPDDPFNIGGDVCKPIIDGLQWCELFADDSYKHVLEGRIRIEVVDSLEAEGMFVEVAGD